MKTIYKKDSKGKIRVLNIWVDGATLHQTSGLEDGKYVLESKRISGKNIGKSNEVSPEQQAIKQMKSKITEKLKKEYFETREEAINSEVILPMLAHNYKDHSDKINWDEGVYIQPKLDSMRCLAIVKDNQVKFRSRLNTDILEEHGGSIRHLVPHFNNLPDGIYDGELYAHGYSFQDCMKMVKKYRPGISENLKLHCYDYISPESFEKRFQKLSEIIIGKEGMELVVTEKIRNEDDLKRYHSQFISDGYEGSMIRHGNEGYKLNADSVNLLKYKDFIDIAIKVIDVIPMDNRPEQGKLICIMEDGQETTVSLALSHEERKEILINKNDYIGQIAEVRFFEYTENNLPRFAACHGFRLDKKLK